MDHKAIIEEIIETLEGLSTPKREAMSSHSFPTSQRVIGVTNPQMREVIKAVRERHGNWIEAQWISLCKALVLGDVFECQVIAYEMINKDRKLLSAISYEDLMDLWRNLDNWASVDHFTVGIYGKSMSRGCPYRPSGRLAISWNSGPRTSRFFHSISVNNFTGLQWVQESGNSIFFTTFTRIIEGRGFDL